MRDKSKAEIKKMEAAAARIAKQRARLEVRGRQLDEAEKSHKEAIETMILDRLRAAGITKLPLSVVLENIRILGHMVGAPKIVSESTPKDNDDFRTSQSGGSEPDVDREGCEVFVKLSSNTSAANRETLEKSGLRWNGRLGGWRGHVGNAAIELLRERFGDRLAILSAPMNTEGGPYAGPPEENPITPPANPPSAGPAGDAIETPPLAEPDTGGDAIVGPPFCDDARLPGSSLPPRPWALPKSPFARRPQVDE